MAGKPIPRRPGLITQMRRDAAAGYSMRETAEMLGITRSVLSGLATRRGITFYGTGGAPRGNRNRAGKHAAGRTYDQREQHRLNSQRRRTAAYRDRQRLEAEQGGSRGEVFLAVPDDGWTGPAD